MPPDYSQPDEPFQVQVAQRAKRLPPYLFGQINAMLHKKRPAGDAGADMWLIERLLLCVRLRRNGPGRQELLRPDDPNLHTPIDRVALVARLVGGDRMILAEPHRP